MEPQNLSFRAPYYYRDRRMVKLQKHKSYTYEKEDGKKIAHHKHLVVLPEKIVSQMGWSRGTDLSISISNNAVVLSRKKEHDEK